MENYSEFETALCYVPLELQLDWVQDCVKKVKKTTKLQELAKNKKGYWFFGKDEAITEEEIQEIERFVEAQFDQSLYQQDMSDNCKVQIDFQIKMGQFSFEKEHDNLLKKEVLFEIKELDIQLKQHWNKKNDIELSLFDFAIYLIHHQGQVMNQQKQSFYSGNNNKKSIGQEQPYQDKQEIQYTQTKQIDLFCKIDREEKKKFLVMKHLHNNQNYLFFRLCSNIFNYRQELLEIMQDFITKSKELNQPEENQQLLNNLKAYKLQKQLKKWKNKFKVKNQENLKVMRDSSHDDDDNLLIDFYVEKQVIKIPLDDSYPKNELFQLQFESIQFSNQEEQKRDLQKKIKGEIQNESSNRDYNDLETKFKIQNFTILFEDCQNKIKYFNILENYSFELLAERNFEQRTKNIQGTLPILDLKLTQNICYKIFHLLKQFKNKKNLKNEETQKNQKLTQEEERVQNLTLNQLPGVQNNCLLDLQGEEVAQEKNKQKENEGQKNESKKKYDPNSKIHIDQPEYQVMSRDQFEFQKECKLKTQTKLIIPTIQLTIQKSDGDNKGDLLIFRTHQVKYSRIIDQLDNIKVNISLQDISFFDYFYRFNNQQFQHFIKLEDNGDPLSIEIQKKQAPIQILGEDKLQNIEYELDEQKVDFNGVRMIVSCQSLLDINFKPDSIVGLKNFIKKALTGQGIIIHQYLDKEWDEVIKEMLDSTDFKAKKFQYDTAEKNIRGNENIYRSYDKANQHNIVDEKSLHIQLNFDQILVNLIHRTNHCSLGSLNIEKIQVDTYKTQQALFVEGSLYSMEITDLTNYPWTINNNLDNKTQIIPNKILWRNENNQLDKCADFYFVNFNNDSIQDWRNKDRVDKMLVIDIFDIEVVYQHQILMRIIDYLTNQIIFLLIRSELIIMNDNIKEDEIPRQVYEPQRGVVEKFFNPTFLFFQLNIEKANLYFKPWPHYTEYLRLCLQSGTINNRHYTVDNRFKGKQSPIKYLKELQCESYMINIEGIVIQYFDSEQYMDISSDFNYNLDFGRLMWAPDIFFAWPESINEIDRGMWLWSVITPIVFKCFRQEYLQIVKGIIHNFTFDDQQDILFNHNWLTNRRNPQGEMHMYIDFPELYFYMMNEFTSQPFSSLFVKNGRFKFEKFENFDKDMFFIGESSQLNFYEYYDHQDNMITEENTEAFKQAYNVLEICFIGDISKVQTLQLQQKQLKETLNIDISFIEDKILDQRQRSAYQQYKIEDLDDKNVQLLYQNLINNESGDKDQQLSFINQKIYAKASVLVNIFHWVMMEQHVFPEVPWYGDLNRIRFEVNLKDVIILLPNYEQRYALATKGFIQYLFLKEKMPAHENLQEMMKKKLIDQEYLNNLGDLYTNSVNVSDLEIFRCDIEDVIYKDFNQVKKRSLISPLTLFWALKFQLGIYDQGDSPYFPTYFKPRHELSLNHLQVNISYRDTILIKNVADFFKKEFSLIRKETPSQKEIINQEIKNRDKDKCPQIMKLDCIIQQLEFYLINDAQQGCVPVLQFNLEEIQLFLDQEKNIKTIFSAMFTFSSAFYNTQASIWEPTIEKTGLILELQLNPQSFPRKFAYIELNPIYDQININFSLELCEVMMQAIKQINQYKSEEEAKKNQKQKEELQELDLPNPTLMTLDRQESSKNLIQGSYRQSRLESQLNYQRMPTQIFQNYQENKIQSSPLKKSRISKTVQNNALSSSNLSQKNKNNLLNKLVKNLSDEKQQFDDAVEYVSPYTIYNELGYTIEVMKDFQAQLNINKKNDGKTDIRYTDISNTMLKNATQFIIPAQGNLNYQVEGKMNFCKLYDGQTREKKKIRIQMRHPKYNNIYINNIDLDKMGKQTYIFKIDSDAIEQILEPVNLEREKVASEVQNQEQKEQNKSQVQDIENGIDNINKNTSINDQLTKFPFTIENITQHSRKIMLIRSNLKFKNLVNKPIQIKLISREDSNNLKIAQQQIQKQQQNNELLYDYSQPQRKPGVTLEYDTFDGQLQNAYVINPGQSIYLPFDKLDHYLQFRYLDLKTEQINRTTKSKYFDRVEVLDFVDTQSEWSKEIDLLHLLNSTETYTNFEVQQLGKEQYCCQFTYQRVNDEASIVVEPSLVLKNCLPVPLMFKLFEEDQQSNLIHLMEGVANPQELVYKLNISLEKNIWIEVRIQGYEESQQVLLHQKDNQSYISEIVLKDKMNKKFNIKIFTAQKRGSIRFFFYISNYVINQTPFNLYYYQDIKENKKYPTNSLFPGQGLQNKQGSLVSDQVLNQAENNFKKIQMLSLQSGVKEVLIISNHFDLTNINDKIRKIVQQKFQFQQIGKQELNLKSLNNVSQQNKQKQKDFSIIPLRINIYLDIVDKCNGICTKIIDINPKYIMINSCKGDIKVAQYKSDVKNNLDAFIIKPQQKLPFYWKSDNDEQKIRIQLQDSYKQYDWSGPIDLLQTYSLMLRNQLRPKDIKVIKSQIREEDDIIYIIISECQNEDQSQFVIENKLQNAQIEIFQEAYYKHIINNNQTGVYQDPEKFKIVLKEGQSIIYGWDLPLEQQEIKVQLKIKDQIHHKYDFDNININFGNNKQTVEVKYEADSKYTDDTYTFYTYIDTDNVFKKLKFYQNDDESGFQEIMKEDNFELSFNLNLKQIGMSLIGRSIENNNKKVELMYITLKNIEVSIMQYQSRRITQAKIDFIQIDNNSQAVTSYPVFFTPSRPSKLNKLNRAHFRLVMEQNLEVKDINLLQSVRCALQPTTIRLNIQYFSQIWSFVSDMMKIFKQKVVDSIFTQFGGFDDDFQNDLLEIELQNQFQSQFDKIDEQYKGQLNYQNTINSRQKFGSEDSQQKNLLFDNRSGNLPNGYYDELDISMEEQLYDWYQKDIESLLGKTFINEISISNLQFNVSFGQSSLENKMQINFIKNIFQTLNIVFSNIENAPVKLDQIMISSSQSTAFSTIKYITTKYKDSFVKSLLTVLASIKIIGNPTNLVKTMARGVYDVIDIPMTGFVKGPIQGAISIAHGVGSLVKHTVSGFFGSMESISEVVASGVSSISQDSRYLLQRENILAQKASNIVPGIYQGVYLLVIGVEKGVTGVLKQPIRGFQTGGGFGLCKGVLKGSVGLFLKPLTGCFDTISKSSEGIKNTATYFDDKPNEEKIRKPRVFYDLDQIFGNFNPFHAEIREFLIETKKQKYYWLTFIDAVPYHDTQDIQHLIIFTNEYIIQKRLEKSKIDLELEVKYLKQVNIKDQAQSVEIKLFQDRKNSRDGQITFDIKHPEMRKQIFTRFQQILGQ